MGESEGESKKERMREREEEKQSVRDPLSSLVPEIENSQVFWDIKWNVEPQEQGNEHTPATAHTQFYSHSLTWTAPGRMALTLISLTLC